VNVVGRDIALYMHWLGFKPHILHLFILIGEFLITKLFDEKIICDSNQTI